MFPSAPGKKEPHGSYMVKQYRWVAPFSWLEEWCTETPEIKNSLCPLRVPTVDGHGAFAHRPEPQRESDRRRGTPGSYSQACPVLWGGSHQICLITKQTYLLHPCLPPNTGRFLNRFLHLMFPSFILALAVSSDCQSVLWKKEERARALPRATLSCLLTSASTSNE